MRRKHLWLLALACATAGTAAVTQAQSNSTNVDERDFSCDCSSYCGSGFASCVYIVCSEPSQSKQCYGRRLT